MTTFGGKRKVAHGLSNKSLGDGTETDKAVALLAIATARYAGVIMANIQANAGTL